MRYIAFIISFFLIVPETNAGEIPQVFIVENRVLIDADIEEVFAFAGNPINDGEWRAEVNVMEANGPWEVGTQYDEDSHLGFNPHYITPTVMTELDPPHLMVVETPEDNLYLKATRSFEETDDGETLMTYRLEVDKRMPANTLGFPIPVVLARIYYDNVMKTYLWRLKHLLE